jgi:DNA-binding Lrp family transcriptional regulator
MRTLDDTDREILRLLLADGRRPYSDIADCVDLSAPAVADRVERLDSLGVIRSFTVDVDRSKLRGGTPVLVELAASAADAPDIVTAVTDHDRVEHAFRTAEGRVLAVASVAEDGVRDLLAEADVTEKASLERVSLLNDRTWSPGLGEVDLALACDECGNTVTSEGVASEIDGTRYHFCCGSCQSAFAERYESFRASA